MKKILISSSLFMLTLLLPVGCSQEEPEKVAASRDTAMREKDARSGRLNGSARMANSCGAFLSNSYYGSGYYTYPEQTIDLSTSANGRKIVLYLEAHDVPNRFVLYDSGGNYIAGSSWLGNSSGPGPWGMSLSASSSSTITFYKSTATYKLRVETSTSGVSDYWSTRVSCF